MERVEKTIFLSYRRTNAFGALAIFQNLTQHGFDVFFDFNGLASGDFERVIVENIKARAHFLVLLTPSALERRHDPGDWLRREIETALANRRNIVPLLLEGFDFSAPAISSQLTGSLAPLKHYNSLRIPPDYFDEAMDRLRAKFLNVPVSSVLHPASLFAEQVAQTEKSAATAAPVVKEKELTSQQWFERAFAAGDPDEKIRLYNEALRLKPDDADAFNNRGNARKAKGDLEGAIKDYNEALRLKPDYAIAFNNRGLVRYAKGDLEGAIKDYNEALRLKPDYANAFYNRGSARKAKGDLEGAIKDYNEALRLKPDYADAFYNRGSARYAKGDLEGAIKDYNEALRLKPDDADAFYNRGLVRYAKGDLEGAIKDYNEALRLKPDYADAFNNRGLVRYAKGDLEGAIKDYNEALRLKPDAIAFNNRGNARKAKGDLEAADEDFKQAQRLQAAAGA